MIVQKQPERIREGGGCSQVSGLVASEGESSATPTDSTARQQSPHSHATAYNTTTALNSAIAGYAGGVTGVIFGHPLDSAKVWLQTNSAGKNKHLLVDHHEGRNTITSSPASGSNSTSSSAASRSSSSGPIHQRSSTTNQNISSSSARKTSGHVAMTRRAVANMSTSAVASVCSETTSSSLRTLRALYSGISIPLVTVGIVQSINFASYDSIRRYLYHRDHPRQNDESSSAYLTQDSLTNVAIAGSVTGGALSFFTGPLIQIKTIQQVTGHNFKTALKQSLVVNGRLSLKGAYVGMFPHLVSETLGRAVYYSCYEFCKRSIVSYKMKNHQTSLSQQDISISVTMTTTMSERMAAAAASGVLCWSVIFPFDTLRNRLYNQHSVHGNHILSTREMTRAIYQQGGVQHFYRGFSLTVLRAGPVAAAVLPIYDSVLEWLSTRP